MDGTTPKQSMVERIGRGNQCKVVWSKLNDRIKYTGGGLARERLSNWSHGTNT